MFLNRFLFELSCKTTETWKHTHTHTHTNEYSIVAFCKNATIINRKTTLFILSLFDPWFEE